MEKQDIIDFASFVRSCEYDRYGNGEWLYLYKKLLYTEEELFDTWTKERKLNP